MENSTSQNLFFNQVQILITMKKITLLLSLLGIYAYTFAQINFTANDNIIPYDGSFKLGVNLGYESPGWDIYDLANLAAGNPSEGLKGAGMKTVRPAMFEYYFEQWGYDINNDVFDHFDEVGMTDLTAFIGFPSQGHRDPESYCDDHQSELFANMYTDIWDDGENGTPVNDENYYALYVYKIVSRYKDHVKFWEIWNEPDFDYSGNGWKPLGYEGNWYENVPEPCDYHLRAPVYHYIRLLRISYEVIKTVAPDDYIAVGGIGLPSFLDIIMRFTDNPEDGSVTAEYPLTGGAYFEVLSYHFYPHNDESLREWSNDIFDFVYSRHSDGAAEGMGKTKIAFEDILKGYGYDNQTYPEKLWIITESNIPSEDFDNIGSVEAQRNYAIKAQIAAHELGIDQLHIYSLAETAAEGQASFGFETMGLYQNLNGIAPYQQTINESGIAARTTSNLLNGMTYSASQTAALVLPDGVKGAAFKDDANEYLYVLWAETLTDMSETASATYSFPADMQLTTVNKLAWDFSETPTFSISTPNNITLTGTPIFVTAGEVVSVKETALNSSFKAYPNPTTGATTLEFDLLRADDFTIDLYDAQGQFVRQLSQQYFPAGTHQLTIADEVLSAGLYFCKLTSSQQATSTIRLTKF